MKHFDVSQVVDMPRIDAGGQVIEGLLHGRIPESMPRCRLEIYLSSAAKSLEMDDSLVGCLPFDGLNQLPFDEFYPG